MDTGGQTGVTKVVRRRNTTRVGSGAFEEVVAVVEQNDERNDVTPDPDGPAYTDQVRALEEEVLALRRRLQDAPKRVRTLEERLLETKGQLAQAVAQNEKLTYTPARRATTSAPCARRSTNSPSRRRRTARCSASTTTERSTSTQAGARCAWPCIRRSTPTSWCAAARSSSTSR
jgi:hypothetical protein